jgi:hypothetical protein
MPKSKEELQQELHLIEQQKWETVLALQMVPSPIAKTILKEEEADDNKEEKQLHQNTPLTACSIVVNPNQNQQTNHKLFLLQPSFSYKNIEKEFIAWYREKNHVSNNVSDKDLLQQMGKNGFKITQQVLANGAHLISTFFPHAQAAELFTNNLLNKGLIRAASPQQQNSILNQNNNANSNHPAANPEKAPAEDAQNSASSPFRTPNPFSMVPRPPGMS